ncbi:MAG: hypothetical protein ACXVAX_00400 [Pseudobdellovibrio sp.]
MNIKSKILSSLLLLTFLSGHTVFAADAKAPVIIKKQDPVDESTEIQDSSTESEAAEQPVQQEVKIDEDQLPGESVVPKTDVTNSVINKKIKFTKRVLVDVDMGSVLDEPLINSNYFIGRASYFLNEEYSFGLGLRSRFGGKTSYSQQLFAGTAQLDFDRAPAPTSSQFVSFGYNFYYGKMSFAKNVVIPATTKLETDFGMQTVGSTSKPFVQAAVNQSFYFSNYVALGVSFGLSLSQNYDPTSVSVRSAQPVPKESDFNEKLQFNQYLSLNLSFLIL